MQIGNANWLKVKLISLFFIIWQVIRRSWWESYLTLLGTMHHQQYFLMKLMRSLVTVVRHVVSMKLVGVWRLSYLSRWCSFRTVLYSSFWNDVDGLICFSVPMVCYLAISFTVFGWPVSLQVPRQKWLIYKFISRILEDDLFMTSGIRALHKIDFSAI